MSTAFELNHDKLAADPRFADVARELDRQSPIDSSEAFNRYCRTACRIWSEQFGGGIGKTSQKFDELLIRVERGGDDAQRQRHEHGKQQRRAHQPQRDRQSLQDQRQRRRPMPE